jgi:predicted RNA-binding Zn-ribbon protein involved in translation (DUF1610 family)
MTQSTLGNSIANDAGSVSFACPKCKQGMIVRTRNEREIVARYTCPSCGFVGPN